MPLRPFLASAVMTGFAVAVRFGRQILADAIEVFGMLQAGTAAGGHGHSLSHRADPGTSPGAQLAVAFGAQASFVEPPILASRRERSPEPTVTPSDGESVKMDRAAYCDLRALRNRSDRDLIAGVRARSLGIWHRDREEDRLFHDGLIAGVPKGRGGARHSRLVKSSCVESSRARDALAARVGVHRPRS